MSSHSSQDVRSLLSGELVGLYLRNPFRVLNLSTLSTLKGAEKRVRQLSVWRETGEFVSDEFAVREAMQTLRDPHKRLLAELFWFHDDEPDEDTVANLRRGDWQQARDFWMQRARTEAGTDRGRRALHNLAVLLHARVVTIEAGKNPLIARMQPGSGLDAALVTDWRIALRAWSAYSRDSVNWEFWRQRARELDDKRIAPDWVNELRALLPDALLGLNRDLARRYADAGFGLAAGTHCNLMGESGFAPDLATQYGRTVVDPVKKRVSGAGDSFLHELKDNRAIALPLAEQFETQVRGDVLLLGQIDPNKRFGASIAREAVAKAFHAAAIVLGLNSGSRGDFPASLTLVSKAMRFADSGLLRADIEDTRERVFYLQNVWTRARPCILCGAEPVDWTILTRQSDGDQRLVFFCADHAQNHDERHLHRVADATWKSQPPAPVAPG